ncbi:methyltransferase domain-containing protein [Mariprofundus erugo]|uniref:Methyltransferase domain-containing protein n=1 Tax=Mariprofundus erugo TaxID=2528639 RepID=A0A5R9GK83_9PROT|nr:methyltransferase domain-containing protein [Mariprofundus erugo]TLS77308.1 methyltransferase domain-containing protein [Mariprofundus erugo]
MPHFDGQEKTVAILILAKDKERSLLRRHPWVFSGAVSRIVGKAPQPGETVEVHAQNGRFLARAAYSPQSQIRARVWSFDEAEEINADFFRDRLKRALRLRDVLDNSEAAALRLVNAESDGLPGVIVDRYAHVLVCQFLSQGAEFWRETIVRELQQIFPDHVIYERSDSEVRSKEGLELRTGLLVGKALPDHVEIVENGLRLLVDVRQGHKTGFYLDQRDSRFALRQYAAGREVLNCFSFSGGFSLSALKAGASRVTNVDMSQPALDLAARNIALNGFDAGRSEHICADVFKLLRQFRDEERRFDLIVLDPPKFADSRGQVDRACRGYKDINLLAFTLLKPGGILFTFSCSGLMETGLFQKVVADAALDAGRDARMLTRLGQAPDHPTGMAFPEGYYLKGLVCMAM